MSVRLFGLVQGQPCSGETAFDEAGLALDPLQGVPDDLDQVGEAGDGEVGEHAALEHRPDPPHRIKVRRMVTPGRPRSWAGAASSTGRTRLRRRSSRRGPPPCSYPRPRLLLPHRDRAVIAIDRSARAQLTGPAAPLPQVPAPRDGGITTDGTRCSNLLAASSRTSSGACGPRRSARHLAHAACTLHTAGKQDRSPSGYHQLRIFIYERRAMRVCETYGSARSTCPPWCLSRPGITSCQLAAVNVGCLEPRTPTGKAHRSS